MKGNKVKGNKVPKNSKVSGSKLPPLNNLYSAANSYRKVIQKDNIHEKVTVTDNSTDNVQEEIKMVIDFPIREEVNEATLDNSREEIKRQIDSHEDSPIQLFSDKTKVIMHLI